MERYPIFDHNPSGTAAAPAPAPAREAETRTEKEPLHFPVNDDSRSLAAIAACDLDAALQLLTERAQYVTGASGAAIALLDEGEMVCRASAGPSAPEVGNQLQMQTGLTGESIRLNKVLQCDDAERDLRVNRESCRALGILSVMVMPLVQDDTVIGVFELLADRTYAFEARDITALTRLSETALTALEHANAARRAFAQIAENRETVEVENSAADPIARAFAVADPVQVAVSDKSASRAAAGAGSETLAKVRTCGACGFPVSEGRTLCVDCEQTRQLDDEPTSAPGPAFLGLLNVPAKGWFDRHMYTLGTIVMALLTILALWIKLR